jgi:hypothetical protein
MTAPPLPPREMSPVMPPPRPPSFCIPATPESLHDTTGTVTVPSLHFINLYSIISHNYFTQLQATIAALIIHVHYAVHKSTHLKCLLSLRCLHQSSGNGFKR